MQIDVCYLVRRRHENRSHLSCMRITADKKTLKTKVAYPTRGVLWLGEEVECMIQTLLDQEAGPRVMTSTHLETQGLFEEVASAMRTHGYRRTGAQVRAKFKREVRQPDPAAVMQVVEERLRTVEAGMVNIRRTLNHHSYHLGFIQRGMVR
ncbi:UNVERIFIED_CONTAM: hypothetical protein K2H54_055832 [Gekko kuhli]